MMTGKESKTKRQEVKIFGIEINWIEINWKEKPICINKKKFLPIALSELRTLNIQIQPYAPHESESNIANDFLLVVSVVH